MNVRSLGYVQLYTRNGRRWDGGDQGNSILGGWRGGGELGSSTFETLNNRKT